MKYDVYITKCDTQMIKGVAVLLMVWHHLFAFPERINYPYTALLDFSFLHIETILAYFGRICISLFAFMSGYGMTRKATEVKRTNKENALRVAVRHGVQFYTRYWLVFMAFIPIGFLLGIYSFEPKEFVKNLFGLSSTYNAEW